MPVCTSFERVLTFGEKKKEKKLVSALFKKANRITCTCKMESSLNTWNNKSATLYLHAHKFSSPSHIRHVYMTVKQDHTVYNYQTPFLC